MYVLYTDVFSITSPVSAFDAPTVSAWRAWVHLNQNLLYFSVVTVMEVRFGIEMARHRGATQKARRLEEWLLAAETVHRERLIPVSSDIAHRAGALLHRAVTEGVTPSTEDALIAASAEIRGFAVLSRNGKHMRALTDHWFDPLDLLPPSSRA